ncbi:MAG: DMT family transporter [Acidimicrobiaceae bacterium]|nr:DMT family transporter [Acidimicrobiaceae bacterium]
MKPRQLFLLLICGAIFGSSYVLVKEAIGPLGAVGLAAVRTAIGTLVLALVCRIRRVGPSGVAVRHTVVLGILSATIPYTFLSLSTQLTNAGTASVVNSTVPVFTLVIAIGLGLARPTGRSWWGLGISLLGVATVAQQRQPHLTPGFFMGILAGLIGSASFAYSAIYARKYFSGAPILRVALSQQLVSVITLLPFTLLFRPTAVPSGSQLLVLIALGVISTALAQVLFFWLISELGAVRTSYVTYLVPLFGVLWGWLFLGEPVSMISYIGMIFVMIGLWLLLTPKTELKVISLRTG